MSYAQERFRAEYREARKAHRETGLAVSRTIHGVGRPCFLYITETGKPYVSDGTYRSWRVVLQESIAHSRRSGLDYVTQRQLHRILPKHSHPRLP